MGLGIKLTWQNVCLTCTKPRPQHLHTPGVIVPICYLTKTETAMNLRSVWDTQYITGQSELHCETVSK